MSLIVSCSAIFISLPFCTFGGEPCQGISSNASISYHMDAPRSRILDIVVSKDGNATMVLKKLKPFCTRPFDKDCWEENRSTTKLGAKRRGEIFNAACKAMSVSEQGDEDATPGEGTISLGIDGLSASFGLSQMSSLPDLQKLSSLLSALLNPK